MEENKINTGKLTIIALAVLALCLIVGTLVFIFGRPADTDVFPPKTDSGAAPIASRITAAPFTKRL